MAIHPPPAEFSAQQVRDDPVLRYFHYSHLPQPLQDISAAFCTLAVLLVEALPRNPERSVALRKLLEAKDAGVRANLPPLPEPRSEFDEHVPIEGEPRVIGPNVSEEPVPFRGSASTNGATD